MSCWLASMDVQRSLYIYNVLSNTVQALVDRPDEVRRMVNFKRMVLTDFKIDIPRLAKKKVLTAALEESGENCIYHLQTAAAQPLLIMRLPVCAHWQLWLAHMVVPSRAQQPDSMLRVM